MARKQNDAPIKLIHILPGNEKSDPAGTARSSSFSYRLGIEGSGHSLSSFLKFLKNLFPTTFKSSQNESTSLHSVPEADAFSGVQPKRKSIFRLLIERLSEYFSVVRGLIQPTRSSQSPDALEVDTVPGPTSYPRLEEKIEQEECFDLYPELPEPPGNSEAVLFSEFEVLREQVRSQQEEIVRVTSQLTDLKNLVLSQQEVLLHLGKELESIHLSTNTPPPKPPRKTKPRSTKSTKPKTTVAKKRPRELPPSQEAQL